MDAVSAVVTIPAAASSATTATPPPQQQQQQQQTLAANTVSVNQSNNNSNNLHTATSNSSNNSLNSIGVSSNSNSSCSSSSTSSNSSGYGSTTTTPTNNYDLQQQQQQTTPTTTPVPTTPVAIAEPIIPVATVAAVTPFYNEALTTQHNLENHHLHHQHLQQQQQQQHYPHPHLLPTNHHQLSTTNLPSTTPQHQQQQQQHHPYLSRQPYYSSYDYQQTAAATHNVAAVAAANVGYNMGIAGTPYELNSSNTNTSAYNAGHYKSSNFTGAINYERSPLVATTKTTNFNHTPTTEHQQQQQSKAISQQNSQFPGGLTATKQRSSTSLIGNSTSTNTSKPQAAATPFYAQPITPTAHSNPTTFYDHLKHKMPLEFGHEAYSNPSAVAANSSYHQQQQKYYAAKTQLKEAAYATTTNINSKNLYGNSNSFFAGPGSTHSNYDKYGSMYPQVPQTGFTTSSHLGNETPPDVSNYRKPVVVNSVNSPSWPWGIDYASGNSRTIPPPNSHLPTATVAPTHATYLPPQPTASARDPYYMAADKYGAMKYDKYPGMSYQQTYVSPTARAHHMWPNTAYASNLTQLNDRHLLATAPAVPAPHGLHTAGYFPSNSNSTLNARQSCCSQPYQPQSCYYPASHTQPPQRLPLNQTPPANAAPTAGYLSAQPSMGQSPHLNALAASCKYGSGIMPDFGTGSKMKTSNDLYLNSHPYENNSSPHNYGYGTTAHASSQQLYNSNAHAQSMAHGLTPSTLLSHDPLNANPASYTNDLSLQTSNFDNYHAHLEPHLSTQNMTAIHGQQQPPPPPAYGPTVAKRALLDYRKPIQPQPPPALTEECYSTLNARDHYNQQELLNTPETTTTFGEYESNHADNNTYTHATENLTEEDKSTEEVNKNISLRDFLANWNDDEDEYQNTEELNFEQAAVIEEVLQTAPEQPPAKQVVEPQNPEIIKEKDCSETKPLQEENKKLQENLSATDVNQYVNLPDIVIDIEKSNNVNNSITTPTTSPTPPKVLKTSDDTNTTLNLNNFDVEKELDELKLKKPANQELTKDLHDGIKETKSVDTPQTSPNKPQLTTQLSFEDLNLEPANKTVLNAITTQLSKPPSSELNEQYFKDLEGYESGSSRHSNESAFEKEYETFINKFTIESSTDKVSKETAKTELEKEVDFDKNVQDFSKFYKRKRKLKEDEQKTTEPLQQNQKKVKTSDTVNNSNFPQVYTKKSRNRLLLNKTQAPRKRKALSAYYKVIHSIRRLGWYRLKRVKEYMTELKEKHLPLIKRQSIKNYTHGLTPNAFHAKSLKALCIMAINTEEFHKILTTPVSTQDCSTAESEEKHICTDPTCETCEVIKSLMEAESIEETLIQQAGESSLENLDVPKAIIYEVDTNELVAIVENVEDIVDLQVQLEETPKMISNEIENVQYSTENPTEFEAKEIIQNPMDLAQISSEISNAEVISNVIEHIQHSKEIPNEFEDKELREHSMDSIHKSDVLNETLGTEEISNEIERVQHSKEFAEEAEANDIMQHSQNSMNKIVENETNANNCKIEFREPTSPEVNLPNQDSLTLIQTGSKEVLTQSNQKVSNEDDIFTTKISVEDKTKLDATETIENPQEIPTETKFSETASGSSRLEADKEKTAKSNKPSPNKNQKSDSENSETSGSDSESSSSSSSSSSSDDDSVDSKTSTKKSVSSNSSSDTNTESDLESDHNSCNSDSSKLKTKQEKNKEVKPDFKITIKEPIANNTNKMELATNSDSDSADEVTPKSPKRIVMRFKKSSISSKSSPYQNSSIERASDESRKYENSESEDEKHFEVILSTTVKLRRKRKILLKIPKSKVDLAKQTDSDSDFSEFSPKPAEQESFLKDHFSSMESNTDNESEDNDRADKTSSTNLNDFTENNITGEKPELIFKHLSPKQEVSLKEHLSSMDSSSDSDSEDNEISEKKSSPIVMSPSPKHDAFSKDPTLETHLDSDCETETKCTANLDINTEKLLEESPTPLNEINIQKESVIDGDEESNKNTNLESTPFSVSPQQNDIKEDIREEGIASEKSLESDSESDAETKDIVENNHLNLVQMKSPTIDLFPQPPTKSDYLSESDEEDQIITEKKNDFIATPLSPRLEHTELHNERESDEEIFKEKDVICEKSPQTPTETLNVEENIFQNNISDDFSQIQQDYTENCLTDCRKEVENLNETSSGSNLNENNPMSDSVVEEVLNLKKTYEDNSSSKSDFHEVNEKSKVDGQLIAYDEIPNKNIEASQNRDEIEVKIYTILSDSESEVNDEKELEKSSRKVQLKKDVNKALLSDSESYSYFEYETDDDENQIKQSMESEPIEISDDESMDTSQVNDESVNTEITENNESKGHNSDEINNVQNEIINSNNIDKLSDLKETELSKEKTEDMELPILIEKQDSKLCADEKVLNIEARSSKDYTSYAETRIESSELESDENQAKDNEINVKESSSSEESEINIKESSSSEESESEIDDSLKISHANPNTKQYSSSEDSDSDSDDNSIEPHEIQSEEKLSNIQDPQLQSPIEIEAKVADENLSCDEVVETVESSKVMDEESKYCSEKSRTPINSPTKLIADDNIEEFEETKEIHIKCMTDDISQPISNNLDITEECSPNVSTIEKLEEEINTTSKETQLQEREECLKVNKTETANTTENSSENSLEIPDSSLVLKESVNNSDDLEDTENEENTTLDNNLNISTDDSYKETSGAEIESLTNSEDFEEKETKEFAMAENNLKSISEELSRKTASTESPVDNIETPKPTYSEDNNKAVDEFANEISENVSGCLEKTSEILEDILDIQEINIEVPKEHLETVEEQAEFEESSKSSEKLEEISSSEEHKNMTEESNSASKSIINNSIPSIENVLENSSSSEDSVTDIAEKMITENEVEECCSYVSESLLQHPAGSELKEICEIVSVPATEEFKKNTVTTIDEPCSLEKPQDSIDQLNKLNIEPDCEEPATKVLVTDIPALSVDSVISVNCEQQIVESTKDPSFAINEKNCESDSQVIELKVKADKPLQHVPFEEEIDPSLETLEEKHQSSEDVEENDILNLTISNDKLNEIEEKSVLPAATLNETSQSLDDAYENCKQNSNSSNDKLDRVEEKSELLPSTSNESCEIEAKSALSPSVSNEMCETLNLVEEPQTEISEEIEDNSIETENENKLSASIMVITSESPVENSLKSTSLEDNLNHKLESESLVENVKISNEFEKNDEQKLPSPTTSICETSLDIKENNDKELISESEILEEIEHHENSSEGEKVAVVEKNQTEISTENQFRDGESVEDTDSSCENKIAACEDVVPQQQSPDHRTTCSQDADIKDSQIESLTEEELVKEASISSENQIAAHEVLTPQQESPGHHKTCSEEAQNQIKISSNEDMVNKTKTHHQSQTEPENVDEELVKNVNEKFPKEADEELVKETDEELVNEAHISSVNKFEAFEKSEAEQQLLPESEEQTNLIENKNENSQKHEEKSAENVIEPEIIVSKATTSDEIPPEEVAKSSDNNQKIQTCEEPVTEHQLDVSEVNVNSNSIPNTLDKDSVSQGDLSGDFYGFKNQSSFEDESGDFHGFEDLEEVTRIRREIENLNEDSAANDGFLSYPTLNRALHKTSTTSLNSSTSSELNELEALEKELSQHQPEMAEEDEEDKETELLNENTKIVSTNDIEHIKQMLESDEEPQTENQSDVEEDKLKTDAGDKDDGDHDKDKFVVKSKNIINDIISSNNSLIPKLSDLCRAALNSSLNSNTSNLAQQHNTDNTTNMTPDVMLERELSVEEALAEMYRQVGVLSDPEDNGDTDNATITGDTDEAHDVLLFNLQEILNSDNNDVYVLQCDMNEENVLNVVQTNDQSQTQDQLLHTQGVNINEVVRDGRVTNTERVNTVQFIGILDTQSAEPQIHIISSDSESEVIILSDDESDIGYRPFIARHERITIPFINDHDMNDSDSLSDISTIHHEEIVPDNLNKFLEEEFYKYLHEKYVQRNISKYYHANRVLKKYKKRFIKTKRQ